MRRHDLNLVHISSFPAQVQGYSERRAEGALDCGGMTPPCGLTRVGVTLKGGDKSPHSKARFARNPMGKLFGGFYHERDVYKVHGMTLHSRRFARTAAIEVKSARPIHIARVRNASTAIGPVYKRPAERYR